MEVTMEAPSFVNTFCVWVMMVIFVVGKIRDLFWRPPALRKGYAPITNARDSFYQRRLYSRVVDCWNRPIASPPGAWIEVMRRTDLSGRALSTRLELEGAPHHACLNLGSYNYLGFAAHDPYCTPRALEALERWGVSQCASRAEGGGTTPLHRELEGLIATHVGAEAAVTYGMGFATNSASIPALLLAEGQQGHGWPDLAVREGGEGGGAASSPTSAPPPPPGRGCLVLSDELNHSSIVAGVKASGARVKVFRHNDTGHLERLLRDSIARGQPRTRRPWKKILILVEGVYSMEGETCPLAEIVALKKRYRAYLYLDEAHSIGALGKGGKGLCEQAGVDPRDVDVLMGTFTKAFGSCGGYVAGSRALVEHLRRVGPAHLFATAMAPAAVAQVVAALRLMRGEDDEGGYRACCRRRVAAAREREREAAALALSSEAEAGGAGAALKRLLLSPLSPRRPPAAAAQPAAAFRPVSAADSDASTWGSGADGASEPPATEQQQQAAAEGAASASSPSPSPSPSPPLPAAAAARPPPPPPAAAPTPPTTHQQKMEPVSGGRGPAKVQALRANANYFRARLLAMGLHVLGDWDSPIMPVMIYHNAFLSLVSRQCLERRLAVVVVGFPATPLFEGRARVCISAAHTKRDLDYALDVIDDVTRRLGLQFGRGSAAARAAAARVDELERELEARRRRLRKASGSSRPQSPVGVAAVAVAAAPVAVAVGGKQAAGKAAPSLAFVADGGRRGRKDDQGVVVVAGEEDWEEEEGEEDDENRGGLPAADDGSSSVDVEASAPCRFCCAGDEGFFHAAAEAARARHAEQDRLAERALTASLTLEVAAAAAKAGAGGLGNVAAGGHKAANGSHHAPSAAAAAATASSSSSSPNRSHASHARGEGGEEGFVAQRVGCGGDFWGGVDPGALALTRFLRARALAAGRLAGGAGAPGGGGGGLLAMMRSAWTR